MNFLLPRLILLAVMFAASIWAIVVSPAAQSMRTVDPASVCASESSEAAADSYGRHEAGLGRAISWQNFLPGSLR